jgi:hypothetical protein
MGEYFMETLNPSIESQVDKYFKIFAWYDLLPGGGISTFTDISNSKEPI